MQKNAFVDVWFSTFPDNRISRAFNCHSVYYVFATKCRPDIGGIERVLRKILRNSKALGYFPAANPLTKSQGNYRVISFQKLLTG